MPDCFSLWIKPLCQTLSNALLISIIFINDIVNKINAEIKLFADDTSLYLIVDNPNDTAFLLNQDLNQLQRWSETWPHKIQLE
jgi:hypothetical protein